MVLTNNNILQASCVIISGLLILLAIQSFGPTPLDEINVNLQSLKSTYKEVNSTMYSNTDDVQKYLKLLESNPNDLGIKLLYDESVKQLDYNKMEMSNIKIQLAELNAKLDVNNSIPQPLQFFAYPKFLVLVLLMPFIASAGTAIISHNDNPARVTKVTFVFGLLFIIFGILCEQTSSLIVASKLTPVF